ncbi:MAG: hypothetical protein IPH26_02060 [Sterolibacteriaceae bacterium]|uniref:Uncharacterized protein n=1 Tax=Candidatus Methylophosphatis roskildensis TaxID=2899263 RepID=A0A9D7HJB9_9PROT|nr:hypothetical protein [Candidatus Methylophosphatis roskildensis]
MADIMPSRRRFFALLAATAAAASMALAADAVAQRFPDVVAAKVRAGSAGHFDFDVTVSSPYDTPQRYADAFRVTSKAGGVFGERKLLHDHAGEQPFTRDLYGVAIPPGIRVVLVQARDSEFGYGGATFEVSLPGR